MKIKIETKYPLLSKLDNISPWINIGAKLLNQHNFNLLEAESDLVFKLESVASYLFKYLILGVLVIVPIGILYILIELDVASDGVVLALVLLSFYFLIGLLFAFIYSIKSIRISEEFLKAKGIIGQRVYNCYNKHRGNEISVIYYDGFKEISINYKCGLKLYFSQIKDQEYKVIENKIASLSKIHSELGLLQINNENDDSVNDIPEIIEFRIKSKKNVKSGTIIDMHWNCKNAQRVEITDLGVVEEKGELKYEISGSIGVKPIILNCYGNDKLNSRKTYYVIIM